jgi:ApaG protein
MYRQTTKTIEVIVEPTYLEDQSRPDDGVYVWSYEVTIANRGRQDVQLLHRHWRITDARGRTLEVRGPGVVGEQPVIKPGETYTYSSYTNLATPSGIMLGTYTMETGDEGVVEVSIPAFSLDCPGEWLLPN